MKATASEPRLLTNLDGEFLLTCKVKGPRERLVNGLAELQEVKELDLTLVKHRRKRSLDANAYAWVLIGKLAAVLRIPPEEVYRQAIRDVGGNFEIASIRQDAVKKWTEIWSSCGIGWIAEEMGESETDGYVNIINYYGSSRYNTDQMARLIDVLADECRRQGIETMSDEELKRLTERWGRKQKNG